MSAISLKSITGITSITTPAGVDNQLTLHTNDTTQRLKVTESGVEITGVTTTSGDTFIYGNIVLPSSGKYLKIWTGGTQGLTLNHGGSFGELDNLTGMMRIKAGRVNLANRFGNYNFINCVGSGSVDLYYDAQNHTTPKLATSATGVTIDGTAVAGGLDISGDIDVDGHTNLDNVSIAGVTTAGDVQMTGGTVFLNKHSVGIGTTTQDGRNAGVSTATGTIIYNAETEKVQVYANATWRNVGSLEPDQSTGYYSSLSDAQSNGLSHYWPGNSSTSLISGLQPDDRKGNPTFNNKEHDGYGATNPFFHFAGQTGGDNPTGYRYTHSADWVGHSFSICYWVKVMQEVTEGESTYVQLGNHSGTRSMFAMSSSGSTNLRGKTITIGDDNANDQIQYEFANWIHVGVRYNYGANSATYYKNGVQTENHTFNKSLSVGTGSNHIYLGYGYWNGSTSNKESCSRMSDIGIWDSTSINGAVFGEIYRAGRIVKGY